MQRLALSSKLVSVGGFAVCALALACSEGTGVDGDDTGGSGGAGDTGGSGGSTDAGGTTAAGGTGEAGSGGTTNAIVPLTFIDIEAVMAMPTTAAATPPRMSLNPDQETLVEVDTTEGFPDPPALRFEVPFSGYNQYVEYDFNLATPMDLTGGALFLNVMYVSGASTDVDCPSGVKFFAKTGEGFVYGEAPWTNTPAAGTWTRIALDLSNAIGTPVGMTFEPADLRSVGISFDTGDCGGLFETMSQTDPVPATYFVDNILFVPDYAAFIDQ